jgi:2-octaprenyl-6-methoxyphenol hydroxylase
MAKSTDIIISGGGIAGLTAAAAFASEGFSVVCVDPAPPITESGAVGADQRSTAFLQPSRKVLQAAGLWDRLATFAAPLQIMRIVDAGGTQSAARLTRDFDAADISDAPFGWNLPNWLLRREMVARLAELPNVDFRPGVATKTVFTREAGALVTLSDGTQVAAHLLIGADGRNSTVRRALGIGVRTKYFGQKALAFTVSHPLPHQNISTEIHRSGGPFTLVPLPDREGEPCSAVVWMELSERAEQLARLDVEEFEVEMTARSCGLLGPLRLVSPRAVWPMISQIADRFEGQRTALMAEAAHVVPPIGAQGLNMSLADLACLLDLARQNPQNIGSAAMLRAYHRRRWPEVAARVAAIGALNRVSMLGAEPLRNLRAATLEALYSVPTLRHSLMRAGLGAS